MKVGVVRFPGSNCDQDAYHVFKDVFGVSVQYLWHQEESINESDLVILPGGFSYGDYLRTGAVARLSPVMKSIIAHAHRGGYVLGICNGFQILCEAGLLPGALIRNTGLKFRCTQVWLRTERHDTVWTSAAPKDRPLQIPIAHGEGRYVADSETLTALENEGQIAFRYCTADGDPTEHANPNGSMRNIAGVMNREGNVLGMMPHPERAAEALLGSTDGRFILESIVSAIRARAR